jgi:hypothetical protein
MRKPYCCEASRHLFNQYYAQQQRGGGEFPVYVGRSRQHGHGLGDIFRSIFRSIMPFFKTIAPHALRAGANLVEDVSRGKRWRDSAKEHAISLAKQVPDAWTSSRPRKVEEEEQTGSGFRKRKRLAKQSRPSKRARHDIFS